MLSGGQSFLNTTKVRITVLFSFFLLLKIDVAKLGCFASFFIGDVGALGALGVLRDSNF